jgi:hypothetical protein
MNTKEITVTIAKLLSAIVAGSAPLVWAIAAHQGL